MRERILYLQVQHYFILPALQLPCCSRARLVEDGYRQLASLSSQLLKGMIRVRFINEQGLDEAGIDQDGVFKGKQVLLTSMNLVFRTEGDCDTTMKNVP